MFKTLLSVSVVLWGAFNIFATTISVTVPGDGRSITFNWEFTSGGGDCIKGQFANGDWWVAPAAGQNAVTVTEISGQGSGQIYCDENPLIESMGILSKDYGNQDAAENIITSLPQTYNYATSLVAGIQRDEAAYGNCGTKAIVGACIDAYNVITVLEAVPADNGANTLRPNITRDEKELLTWDDFDLTRLPSVDYLDGTDAAGMETIRKTWSHHIETLAGLDTAANGYSEGGRAFRADLVTNNYAAGVAQGWHNHLISLMSDDNNPDDIKPALAAMLVYGKDMFYHIYNEDGTQERWFGCGAGQHLGRFPPVVLFAALTKDPFYADIVKQASATNVDVKGGIHELEQVNPGFSTPLWGDGVVMDNQYAVGGYWGEMMVKQTFEGASGAFVGRTSGKKTSKDPYGYIDGPGIGPGGAYMAVSGGPMRALAAEMYLMPEMCDIVNYDALITYANRLTDVGVWAAPDPCAPPDPRENPDLCDSYRARGCSYYGLSWNPDSTSAPTWGPDPDSVAAGNWAACIKNGTDPLTGQPQNGRYTSRHGAAYTPGYSSGQVENNWSVIRNGRSACTRPVSGIKAHAQAVPEKAALYVSPSPSTGFIRVAGSSGTYRVYDRNGAFIKMIGAFGMLDAGVYVVSTPDGSAVTKVVIAE